MSLTGLFSKLEKCRVAVAGDLLLDAYTFGKVERVSPEAPVPIIHAIESEYRAGGAGNVVLNLISMGAEVVVFGRVGDDPEGERLRGVLADETADVTGVITQSGYKTPIKNRIIADEQQLLRIDHEEVAELPELFENEVIANLPRLFDNINVLALSDYGKGYLTVTLTAAMIEAAKECGITVIVDPKGSDYSKYWGVDLIKPNASEAYAAAAIERSAAIELTAAPIFEVTAASVLMITRSQDGISIFYPDGRDEHYPVRVREVQDVTGAGDTVLAMVTVALANGLTIGEAAQLANAAASIAIERVGCARVTLPQLARCFLKRDAKVFGDDHSFALRQALADQRFVVVILDDSSNSVTTELYQVLKRLADEAEVIVYLEEENPTYDYISLLASLDEIAFILLKSDTLACLQQVMEPEATYYFSAGILQTT